MYCSSASCHEQHAANSKKNESILTARISSVNFLVALSVILVQKSRGRDQHRFLRGFTGLRVDSATSPAGCAQTDKGALVILCELLFEVLRSSHCPA
ncbi:MAG TPA: hypothetical protein DCG57_09935 [Candidatus Riflebacteria bacterium]|nr:hypothetical protein [Candidatus Riflebacteria bacterium]